MSVVWANPSQTTQTHAHTHTQGRRWEPCLTWLYTLTHIATPGGGAAEWGGGGGGRRRRWQQWCEAEDCLATYDGAHTHTHTFTFATVPQFWYPATPPPVGERKLTFHCLHNLDWPIERARDRERERGRERGSHSALFKGWKKNKSMWQKQSVSDL